MQEDSIRPQRISKNLKNLYLDPNNYRFVDNEKHTAVNDRDFLDPNVQKRTRNFIEGHRQENIKDLLASLKSNGFLDVDIIQVKDLGGNNYLVLEGNRRVTALKSLQEDYEKGLDVGKLDPSIFRSVPFEIHNNDEGEKHLIVMGLKHISGNKKWATYNQAKLLYDFLSPYNDKPREEYIEKENELCNSLGISKAKLRAMVRVYNLVDSYKKSDFGDQFNPSMYGIFEEIIKKPVIRTWLEWDDDGYCAKNITNLDRLFSWFSETETYSDEDSDNNSDDDSGFDTNEGYDSKEPIITKSLEIRDLALFINNDEALTIMEQEQSLARGLAASGSVDKQNYMSALNKLDDSSSQLLTYKSLVSLDDINALEKARDRITSILPKKSSLDIEGGTHSICFEFGISSHLSDLEISRYKSFKNFSIKKLNKINIFAGFNNSGKTSLLEAIYILTQQNDISSFFNIIKNKNKANSLSPVLLDKIFTKNISISGVYNETPVSVELSKFEATSIDRKDDYIASYLLSSTVDTRTLLSTVHTYVHNTMQRTSDKVERLCPTVFKSPYIYDLDELIRNYTASISTNIDFNDEQIVAIKLVISFLSKVDDSIIDLRFTEDTELRRFIVESSLVKDRNFDITTYGEGLQRIFYIALSFAACRNGILLIDEFETAIHYTLLVEFSAFIQKLSDSFNVQVFITTHSSECINSFVSNNEPNDVINGYQLIKNEENINVKFVSGERLKKLIDSIKLDIRGGNHV